MKKILHLALFSSIMLSSSIMQARENTNSILFFAGGGASVGLFSNKIQELLPINYPQSNFQSMDKISYNRHCTAQVCLDDNIVGGINLEAGVKIRPISLLEIDIYGNIMFGGGSSKTIPNAMILPGNTWPYRYKSKTSILSGYAAINADLTLRFGSFGISGGIGMSYWMNTYNVEFEDWIGSKRYTMEHIVEYYDGWAYHFNLGINYRINQSSEVSARFTMPFNNKHLSTYKEGNNGLVNYKEIVTINPYIITLTYRWYL
ncbi:hypothetical protein CQA53_08100 [Helicobacter didelphidarum]|uniref:Outer membrane protein beta-barrel domain-containing protein n=1 Tax=Helicobacter didelphidarum TaxID=2040648 RepID=A0A3D8IGB0_9HELI|nr:hypothetical protein [Helicobacter didelphidarum]RDU64035.1 hypothetical protein CQA53_08100 [Helicobacter didelphidarum]